MTAVPVVLSPAPFSRATEYVEVPAGRTVRAMLAEAVNAGKIELADLPRAVLYVDGAAVPRDEALDRVLVAGQTVNVVVEPLGGGGGGGGKNIGQTLLTIAVIAVSAWVGGGGLPLVLSKFAMQAASAAILVGGQLAISQLFKPDQQSQAQAADRYALQSGSNQYRQWQPFPLALGEVVAAPDFVAKTFTQNEGDEQWIYGILGLHYGPCEVSEERIGDTLISSMGANDVRIVRHLTPGPRTFSLYPNDVDQLDLSEKFEEGVEIVRAASDEGQRFDFDLYFPGGLHWRDDKGRYNVEQNDVQMSWRPINEDGDATGGWSAPTQWTFRSSTYDPLRVTRSISLPLGRYEFRLKKLNKPADQNNKRVDDMYWTALKAIAFRKPIADETLSIIEFAVRATAITQGTLATITCRIKPIAPTWNGSSWGAPVATSNPAALTRWLLTGPAPAKPLLPAQADVRLRAWSQLCDQYGWTANIYLTDDRKQDAALALLEQSGRASLFWDGTQVAASAWVEKPAPRQMFAGANLQDHSWQIVYPDEVHALRVEFQNIDRRGEPDELYVYADGYAEQADPANGIQAASLIEAMRVEGQRKPVQAHKDGRWALGVRKHQRRIDTWSTSLEHLACSYGDRVRLAWSRVDGGDSMRVRCRRWAGALVSGLRLTQPVEMKAGETYAVDMRLTGGVMTNVPVVTTPGLTREIVFVTPRGAEVTASADDLVVFGTPGRISEDVEVIGIEPGEELTARITGMRYVAPLLMAGETGPIPPLQTRLTGDRQKDPPQPTLLGLQVLPTGVRIGFNMPPWKGSPVERFSVRWRSALRGGEVGTWTPLPSLGGSAMSLTTPPLREAPRTFGGVETTRVQIEIVAVTADGRQSPALLVTAQEDVVPTPLPGDWTITPFAVAPDGSRQLGFSVEGRVSNDRVRRVLVEYGPSAEGPWTAAYDGPPVEGVVRATITVDQPGQYWFPISHWSEQGVPGGRMVFGPDTTEGQIASDLAPGAPTAVLAAKTSEEMAAEMLRGALWREYTDGLLYIGGRDVATVVQEAVEQFTDPEGSFAGSMQLLGGKNAAGTGFILNANTVFVSASPGGSAVTSLRDIELRSDASYQAVQRLDKVVEGFAETSTLVVVNDVVVGVRATNDGSVGALTFQADAFSFVDRNGGQPRYPIRYGTDGILVLEDIVIRNAQVLGDLIVGTRSIRDNNVTRVDAAKMPGVTQWSPHPQEVIRYNINLDYPAKLIALATGSHDYYASGDPEYGFEIRVDGTPVAFEGGANVRVTSLGTSGYASLGAGTHTVTVHWHAGVWNGQGNVRLAAANLIVMAAFK